MGKIVNVKLVALFCDFSGNEPDDDLEITGSFWGVTYNDPSVEMSRREIFSFPSGPVKIAAQKLVSIDQATNFTLGTPSIEPPNVAGKYLKFGGELVEKDFPPDVDDPLGSSFKTITTYDITQPEMTSHYHVRFQNDDQEIRADFELKIIGFF